MSAPKSITKVNKNGVTYTSNVDAAQYYIHELSRGALRDVAKFIRTTFRLSYYGKFARHTGRGPRSIKGKVLASASTKYPRVEIGIPHAAPGKPVDGFYAYWQEKGSVKQSAERILKNTVESNIAKIVEIESKYLSGLEGSYEALCPGEDDIEIEEG